MIGNEIRFLRNRMCLTRDEFAAEVGHGVIEASVRLWEDVYHHDFIVSPEINVRLMELWNAQAAREHAVGNEWPTRS